MRFRLKDCGVVAVAVVWTVALVVSAQAPDPEKLIGRGDKLYEQKNYREAYQAYEEALEAGAKPGRYAHTYGRIIAAKLRLQLFDEALESAENHVKKTQGTWRQARAHRLAGNLYLRVPHWGTRAGGEFHRAQHKQGIRLQSWQYDKRHAVSHLENARELYAKYDSRRHLPGGAPGTGETAGDREEGARPRSDKGNGNEGVSHPAGGTYMPAEDRKGWHNERIECVFDLAGAVTRFSIYSNQWYFWWNWWGERDEFLAKTAGEEDFSEYHSHWQKRRERPIGLRVDEDGNPIFPRQPDEYSGELSDDQKVLYLLHEVRELDRTENAEYAAQSYYRQGMLARARFGMDRLNNYANIYYSGGKHPLKEELEDHKPWELEDEEALVLAGGTIRRVTLPDRYNVLKLLRVVESDYRQSGFAPQAGYGIGVYYQSRQQYRSALEEYRRLREEFPDNDWARNAGTQISRILEPQVRLSQTGVQLPGEPARLQLTYRNLDRVWLVARRIDLRGFLEKLRANVISDNDKRNWQHSLTSWHRYFVQSGNRRSHDYWIYKMAAEHLGEEVARWEDRVEEDGTHRYSHATLQSPIDERGAYLIYCYERRPKKDNISAGDPQLLTRGDSRAVMVLTDVAIVEKKAAQGNLYYISDARGGRPEPGADVSILEVWNERDGRQWRYRKETHDLTTNQEGMLLFGSKAEREVVPDPPGQMQVHPTAHPNSRLHILVTTEDGRLAWSGMHYWRPYGPSRMRRGQFAYVITDRPVYRPEQSVKFKIWLRHMREGNQQNMPNQQVQITIYDPKNNKVHTESGQTDQFGGYDGQFTLEEEPKLGVYRIHVHGRNYAGGQNFRVEEYKKPEFEVTVEPGTKHAKLGETIEAKIKAEYYFGAPVTEGTVQYRVFREEYRHRHYPRGYWDWLYGPGYGFAWYDYEWFPWWRRVASHRVAPHWWWGWYGGGAPTPVRELVKQDTAQLDADGTVDVKIDTEPALRQHGDLDHRYVVQAEVRDPSRRTIEGEGSVKATRQAFYAFVNSDQGWYRPGEEMEITVRCLTPGNEPVEAEGLVTVSRVVFGGPNNAQIKEEELKRWTASTDERGILKFRLRHERSDQLKIKFATPDRWGGTVEGYGLVWVAGRDFDGRLYRFNNLELLTDKRTYQPGETCHLMINTRHRDSRVIFSDRVDNSHLLSWRLLHLPDGHKVVEIPITKEHHPNFFVEATTVADVRVHQQAKRICVPPEEQVLEVDVRTDKPEYKPGEKANVRVSARDLEGNPVQAQICLSAFDRSVLYIQEEYTPEIKKFFHGHLRHHRLQMQTNLLEQFSAVGSVSRPFQQLHPYPPEWNGIWGISVDDWRTIGVPELSQMSYGGAGGMRGGVAMEGRAMRKAAAAPAGAEMAEDAVAAPAESAPGADKAEAEAPGEPAQEKFAEAQVREQFADTALWLPALTTDQDGTAEATVEMPENLTTWKINSWAMTRKARVGQTSTSAVTTKNLLVRLQAPRFFMEYDEVVLSANVHNYLDEAKTARVSLEIPEKLLTFMEGHPAEREIEVPADGQKRVDWRVKVLKEGTAKITVRALTDEESDAMAQSFPVLVHGMTRQVAKTGSMRVGQDKETHTLTLEVPEKRRPELTRLEVQYSPTLAGAMLDALPYCLEYPYGCTEQTVSRFLPAVLTLKTLQNMGIELEDVRQIRGRMEEIRRIERGENRSIYADNPVFDSDRMHSIIQKGLRRITDMQHGDGGWAWWKRGDSSAYLTSYILHALVQAQEADVQVDQGMVNRGMNFLKGWEEQELRKDHWSPHARHAFVAYVLSLNGRRAAIKPDKDDERPGECIDRLYKRRDELNLYGKALLSMTLANLEDEGRARTVLRNIMQYKQENPETEMAWFRTPRQGWWYWWNNDIETSAWILRAIVKLEPKSEVAPMLVRWLLENRRNGYYWRSTRDTTLVVTAMSEYVVASGEGRADYTLTLDFDDGEVVKKVEISRENFFTYDNKFVLEGVSLGGGRHTLKITKDGPGALYYNSYLRYFTKEEDIEASGLHLEVKRRYFRLEQIPYEVEVEGAEGQKIQERRLRYERVPVEDGDRVESGDRIQVELEVSADNNYTYLAFEDMKPAGCEPIELRSGYKRMEGFGTYMELRDEKVTFFLSSIEQGTHLLRYRLRAETPGRFHALPSVVYGMYVPELRANSDELVMEIVD